MNFVCPYIDSFQQNSDEYIGCVHIFLCYYVLFNVRVVVFIPPFAPVPGIVAIFGLPLVPILLDTGLKLIVILDAGGMVIIEGIVFVPEPMTPGIVPLTNGLTVIAGADDAVPDNDDTGGDAKT
jgi:hypothetical protein